MNTITFFAPRLSHAVETMAYLLAMADGYHVRVATSLDGDEKTEHPWSLRRIKQFGGIEISPYDGVPAPSDVLVFYLVRHGRLSDKINSWRAHARSAVFLSRNEGPISWSDWLRERAGSFPHYLRARRIRFYPYLHPKFVVSSERLNESFAPIEVKARRRWRVGFLGNRQPPERTVRLAQCKHALAGAEQWVKWHEYGGSESGGARGIEGLDYLRCLSDMDFCISPPGWGLQWTHRTVEALVRGSIPIIEDPQVYGLELRDGENCIVATPDDWGAAVRRALDLAEADIQRMRQHIVALREAQLVPPRAIERFRSQLLVPSIRNE